MKEIEHKFSWVEIYKEIARRIKDKDNSYLVALLNECEECQTNYLQDKNNSNKWMYLDSFTFFGSFNRDVKFENRIKILNHLKKELQLSNELPNDFNGIPTMENRNSWFQNKEEDAFKLNQLFNLVLNENLENLENLDNRFNEALKINGVGISKLTTGLFWINPDKFMPIAGPVKAYLKQKFLSFEYDSKNGISAWNEVFKNMDFRKYNAVLEYLDNKQNNKKSFQELSLESIESSVENEILENKNVIFHGAPGTGKTYSVMNAVKRLTNEDTNRFTLVQFHPSYGYEDFIDGIKPIKNDNNSNINLGLVNGTFKELCKRAYSNLVSEEETKPYFFIADEINRAELSRVFGELLLCLEDDKRLRIENGKTIGTKIKTQNSNLWEEKHAVIIENSELFFGIPENLYFIGTMNDIDRSVDSFDMALRRRFSWIRTSFDETPIRIKYNGDKNLSKYLKLCNSINNYITTDKDGFELGMDYELGQSYFLKPNDLNQDELDIVYNKYISPLLREYLRAVYDQKDIDYNINKLEKKFKL